MRVQKNSLEGGLLKGGSVRLEHGWVIGSKKTDAGVFLSLHFCLKLVGICKLCAKLTRFKT